MTQIVAMAGVNHAEPADAAESYVAADSNEPLRVQFLSRDKRIFYT